MTHIATRIGGNIQLLEIAIGDIVAAPVGHRVELQAMGELHFVGLQKLRKLLPPFPNPFGFLFVARSVVGGEG